MIPMIIKLAGRKPRFTSEVEKYIPTYKEMRTVRLHPNMTTEEKWAHRGKRIQHGYIAGSALGGVLGGIAGVGVGHALRLSKILPRNIVGKALADWVLPASIGTVAYRAAGNYGKVKGEERARRELEQAGSPIEKVSPLSLSDRGAFDPHFMGSMFAIKSLQAAISEKGREGVRKGLDKIDDIHHSQGVRNAMKDTADNVLEKIRNIRVK